uniref:Uncharacterized protein n=1 Tax=Cacopsylla melanoneura TaxID=428564 RepID=A0A8D9E4R4_9HEMI
MIIKLTYILHPLSPLLVEITKDLLCVNSYVAVSCRYKTFTIFFRRVEKKQEYRYFYIKNNGNFIRKLIFHVILNFFSILSNNNCKGNSFTIFYPYYFFNILLFTFLIL